MSRGMPKWRRKERALAVEMLTTAKSLLARNAEEAHDERGTSRNRCICHALAAARNVLERKYSRPRPLYIHDGLSRVILGRLNNQGTLERWLVSRKILAWEDLSEETPELLDRVQATRHAWIDSLIEEVKGRAS